jgi:hypothetical protein
MVQNLPPTCCLNSTNINHLSHFQHYQAFQMTDLFNNYYDIFLHNIILSTLWLLSIIVQMVSGVVDINPMWIVFVALMGFYLSATFRGPPS